MSRYTVELTIDMRDGDDEEDIVSVVRRALNDAEARGQIIDYMIQKVVENGH